MISMSKHTNVEDDVFTVNWQVERRRLQHKTRWKIPLNILLTLGLSPPVNCQTRTKVSSDADNTCVRHKKSKKIIIESNQMKNEMFVFRPFFKLRNKGYTEHAPRLLGNSRVFKSGSFPAYQLLSHFFFFLRFLDENSKLGLFITRNPPFVSCTCSKSVPQ